MKIDLHVHSRYSTRPSQWIFQRLGCAESYTEPLRIYHEAKARGMDAVTIADHNTLAGSLEIAHLPDTFLSVEITSYFPDDRCKVHVLALNIDEKTFTTIQKIRENVFDLAAFLQQNDILHVCAHPLYGVNNRLTVAHVEKLMLLFRNMECNGARDGASNDALRRIVASLTPKDIEQLADRHGIVPAFSEPWRKVLTGGSDDHSGMNIARMYTVAAEAQTLDGFFDCLRNGSVYPAGKAASPATMSHNLYAIAWQFSKDRFKLDPFVGRDIFLSFADRFLGDGEPRESGWRTRLHSFLGERRYRRAKLDGTTDIKSLLRHEAARFIMDDPTLMEIARSSLPLPENKGQEWLRFVNASAGKVLKVFADSLFNHCSGAKFFDIFQIVGSAGALYTLLAPHFVSYSVFQEGRRFSAKALEAFEGPRREEPLRVGHFTDTFFEINGVARTLQQSLELAARKGKSLTVVTCDPHCRDCGPNVRNFQPIGVYDLPEYPEQKFFYPPLLDMIQYIYDARFTHLHVSTPGPIGLAALLGARILKLPIHGTYHTQIPQYARQLTGDEGMEDLAWKYTLWFYNQMDKVFAPSQETARELQSRGVRPDKLLVYPRGVDVQAFHPGKRNGFLKRYDVAEGPSLLFVGRLSKEKNLDVLAEAFLELSPAHPGMNLVLVGDGPYAPALKEKLNGTRCVFTGALDGEELAACYASCDLFVFPSLTDTFGNVILEAQASGLPTIVSNVGGPKENVIPDETGLILADMTSATLAAAIRELAGSPERLAGMSRQARAAMENRSSEQAFDETWTLYECL